MMKKILIIFLIMFSFFNKVNSAYDKLAYEFKFNGIEGNLINLKDYKKKLSLLSMLLQDVDLQINMRIYKHCGLIIKKKV